MKYALIIVGLILLIVALPKAISLLKSEIIYRRWVRDVKRREGLS